MVIIKYVDKAKNACVNFCVHDTFCVSIANNIFVFCELNY